MIMRSLNATVPPEVLLSGYGLVFSGADHGSDEPPGCITDMLTGLTEHGQQQGRWRPDDVDGPGDLSAEPGHRADHSFAGDSEVFAAPARVAVHVKDWHGDSPCDFRLYDPAGGDELDLQ
jgi:hypothetical protein